MSELLIYLLKSAGLLSLFYFAYQLSLKNETSFTQNRMFLLSGIFAAALLPSINFTNYSYVDIPIYFTQFPPTVETTVMLSEPALLDWWQILGMVYFAVSGVLLFRFFLQICSIYKLISSSEKIKFEDFKGVETTMKISPFSFFNVVVFNPNLYSEEELRLILKHEKIHVRQKHSVDMLLANLIMVILWFNPLSWSYKKIMEQNLEFLADSGATEDEVSKTAYQRALLKVTVKEFTPSLSNNFYQSSIKKRIVMLNKQQNPKNIFWKTILIFPAILAFMFIFSCSNPTKTIEKVEVLSENAKTNPLIIVNGKIKEPNFDANSISSRKIARMNVLKEETALEKYGEKAKNGAIEITLKGEETEMANTPPDDFVITEDVLIVVNGKIKEEGLSKNPIPSENIAEIFVLRGKAAIDKYGKKGEHGVLEITLKNNIK